MPPLDVQQMLANRYDQDRGIWVDVPDPVTGEATGFRLRVAGPDSEIQRRAHLRMADRLAELASPDGTISAEARENARLEALASCVVDWEILDNGKPIPPAFDNILRVLKISRWLERFADRIAGDRSIFWPGRG